MNESAVGDLEARLELEAGGLSELESIDPAVTARLCALVDAAIAHEDATVARSLESAINAIPRPLRGRARALLLEDS